MASNLLPKPGKYEESKWVCMQNDVQPQIAPKTFLYSLWLHTASMCFQGHFQNYHVNLQDLLTEKPCILNYNILHFSTTCQMTREQTFVQTQPVRYNVATWRKRGKERKALRRGEKGTRWAHTTGYHRMLSTNAVS